LSSVLEDLKLLLEKKMVLKMEPFEHLVIDTPDEFSGAIIEKLGKRKSYYDKHGTNG